MTTATFYDWRETTRDVPCLSCGKIGWCATTAGLELLRCMRGGGTPDRYRHVRDHNDGGRLFALIGGGRHAPPKIKVKAAPSRDWAAESARYVAAITPSLLDWLSLHLSVTIESLLRVRCGWCAEQNVYTFPESNAAGAIIGISTRYPSGCKGFIKGGHRALTIPVGLDITQTVLAVEGVTDVAACLTLGIEAVGRFSNHGGVDYIADLLRDAADVFVVGENDRKPDGREPGVTGAKRTAEQLAARWNRSVRWALPPHGSKDIRKWLVEHDAHKTEELRGALL